MRRTGRQAPERFAAQRLEWIQALPAKCLRSSTDGDLQPGTRVSEPVGKILKFFRFGATGARTIGPRSALRTKIRGRRDHNRREIAHRRARCACVQFVISRWRDRLIAGPEITSAGVSAPRHANRLRDREIDRGRRIPGVEISRRRG